MLKFESINSHIFQFFVCQICEFTCFLCENFLYKKISERYKSRFYELERSFENYGR